MRRTAAGYAIADALEGARAPVPVTLDSLCRPGLDLAEDGEGIVIRSGGRALCRVRPPAGFAVRLARASSDDRSPDRPLCSRSFGDLEPTSRITLAGSLSAEAVETGIEVMPCGAGEWSEP